MKPKKARKLIVCLWMIGMIIMMFAYIHIIFVLIGLITASSGVVVSILFYKCPHCGKHLGRSGGDFCPYCGGDIDT